jgi:hypothetical protein
MRNYENPPIKQHRSKTSDYYILIIRNITTTHYDNRLRSQNNTQYYDDAIWHHNMTSYYGVILWHHIMASYSDAISSTMCAV